MKPHVLKCPFCNISQAEYILANDEFIVVYDRFPVTALHALVISRRHVSDFFALNHCEQRTLNELLVAVKDKLSQSDSTIAGFNIGMNCGESAGQTIEHFHAHVIPRRRGDMADPRGGVRGVIPQKQRY